MGNIAPTVCASDSHCRNPPYPCAEQDDSLSAEQKEQYADVDVVLKMDMVPSDLLH